VGCAPVLLRRGPDDNTTPPAAYATPTCAGLVEKRSRRAPPASRSATTRSAVATASRGPAAETAEACTRLGPPSASGGKEASAATRKRMLACSRKSVLRGPLAHESTGTRGPNGVALPELHEDSASTLLPCLVAFEQAASAARSLGCLRSQTRSGTTVNLFVGGEVKGHCSMTTPHARQLGQLLAGTSRTGRAFSGKWHVTDVKKISWIPYRAQSR
jgi:hypothetical protein